VGFVEEKGALWQVLLRILRFSPVEVIPPLLHIHSCSMGPLAAAVQ
jgi:hypothetical protein